MSGVWFILSANHTSFNTSIDLLSFFKYHHHLYDKGKPTCCTAGNFDNKLYH
jgi:hypothetical protein